MPTLTTSVIFFPENPFQAPLITYMCLVGDLGQININHVYLVTEVLHMVENFVHRGHHVLSINNHWHIAPVPQSNMENCTVFGEVDLLSCSFVVDNGF